MKSEREILKSQISLLFEENDKMKDKVKRFRKRTKSLAGRNKKLYRHNKVLKVKLLMKNESQPKAMDNNKLDVLAEIVLNFPRTREFSEDHVVINDILDDIITNTLSISSLKLNTIKWKGKEKVYDLRIINKDQNKFELQSLQENRCNQYLQAESRWKLKFSQLKTQLQHKEQKLQ